METPLSGSTVYHSPVKHAFSKQHGDHSSTSSDQLSAVYTSTATSHQYSRCPLIPCMPDLKRGPGSVTNQHPISELAGLHAALSSEGVHVLHSPTQQQPQLRQSAQQLPPQLQAQSPLHNGLQQHKQHAGTARHSAAAADMLLSPQTLEQSGDPQLHAMATQLQDIRARNGQRQPSVTVAPLASLLICSNDSPHHAEVQDARASLDVKFVDRHLVERLRQELSTATERVTQRLSTSPVKMAAAAGNQTKRPMQLSSSPTSSGSSRRLDPAYPSFPQQAPLAADPLQQQKQQQHQQELLGLAGASLPIQIASLQQHVRKSAGLHRLLQQKQQQQQPTQQQKPTSERELAQQGLQQMQDVTEVSNLLAPALALHHQVVAEANQTVGAVDRLVQKYPQYTDPSALQCLLDSKRELEVCCEALKRELRAKETAHDNTLGVLRESNLTPRDKRLSQLQHENVTLQRQLLSRDAQLQRYEQELKALRQQQRQRGEDAGAPGELSPVSAIGGQRSDSNGNVSSAARQVSRSLWGLRPSGACTDHPYHSSSGSGSSHGLSGSSMSGDAGSSRSSTPSSRASGAAAVAVQPALLRQLTHQQQPQQLQQAVDVGEGVTMQFERQRAAFRSAIPQLQQQLQALREPAQQRLHGTATGAEAPQQPGQAHLQRSSQHSSTGCSDNSTQPWDSSSDLIRRLREQYEQQAHQEAAMHAAALSTHKRQLETERQQHECTQQRCKLLEAQTQQLQVQLEQQQVGQRALQEQLDQLQQQLTKQQQQVQREQNNTAGSNPASLSSHAERQAVGELQGQLALTQQQRNDLQQQVDRLLSESTLHKSEMRQQTQRLLLAEQALLGLQAQKEALQEETQRREALAAQLTSAQQAAAAAEGVAQECRRQLAAAGAEKESLMDRIRQLADRTSLAGSQPQSHRSSTSNSESTQQQQQQQAELSAVRAELEQQVSALLGLLSEKEGKQERLTVANAQLQERLSRLQAELASRDAAGNSSPHEQEQQLQQLQQQCRSQQQQLQELQQQCSSQQQQLRELQQQDAALHADKERLSQQVSSLQQQLADAQAAAAAAAESVAAEAAKVQQQQQEASQQQQQQDGEVVVTAEEVAELQAALEDRTQELQEWRVHAEALECDLEDLKAQLLEADGLQQALSTAQAQLEAGRAQQAALQQELGQARTRMGQLEYELHGYSQERSVLRARVEALTAELVASREGAADLRLRLEHFTGPAGPQARVKQLEASLHNVQRRAEAAEGRASAAAARASELNTKLGAAEDTIVALEGQISVLEEQLAALTRLPQ